MDQHLAFIQRLQRRLQEALPGHDTFLELSGYDRPTLQQALELDPDPRESAVLILLYPVNGRTYTLLIQRPKYDGVHSGQIAFPGGRREPEDMDLATTALREFKEETGMGTKGIEVIGELSRLYIPPSRSLVTPFIALADALGDLRPDPTEVATIIHAPFHDFMQPDSIRMNGSATTSHGKMKVPYFEANGAMVWGATAMMIAELREIMLLSGRT